MLVSVSSVSSRPRSSVRRPLAAASSGTPNPAVHTVTALGSGSIGPVPWIVIIAALFQVSDEVNYFAAVQREAVTVSYDADATTALQDEWERRRLDVGLPDARAPQDVAAMAAAEGRARVSSWCARLRFPRG